MKKLFTLIAFFTLFLPVATAKNAHDNGGSGLFKAQAYSENSLPGYVVYHPTDIGAAVEHEGMLPLVVWANEKCNNTCMSSDRFLTDLASYGYIIVAPDLKHSGGNIVDDAAGYDISKAIDWALEQNNDNTSTYYNTIDSEYIALAIVDNCDADMSTFTDKRIATYVMLNSYMAAMSDDDAKRHFNGPILYVLSNANDDVCANTLNDYESISEVPIALASLKAADKNGALTDEDAISLSSMLRDWIGWQFKGQSHRRSVFVTHNLRNYPAWSMISKNFIKGYTYNQPQPPAQWPPKFDSEYPDVHDPVMAYEDGRYYMFTTGMGIGMMSSTDLKSWQQEKAPLDHIPDWVKDIVPAYNGHTWAPDIVRYAGMWYLYYSCSTFGKNISAIGVMCTPTLDPQKAKWIDLGMVVRSQPGINDWNAIDPNVNFDDEGNPWLTFGSFWDGIQLVRLDSDMTTIIGAPSTIARRRCPCKVAHLQEHANTNAIEAPFIYKHDGMYYLFVSYDYCCQGLASTYKTAVGRSENITGPYFDIDGVDMADLGGTVLIGETDKYAGVGHCAVYDIDGTTHFIAHAYDKNLNGRSKLLITPITWIDGWPYIK